MFIYVRLELAAIGNSGPVRKPVDDLPFEGQWENLAPIEADFIVFLATPGGPLRS